MDSYIIKRRLHAAHLAADSMLRRARRTVFWPGMGAEIKQMADACEACQQSKPRNQKETLIQHEIGQQPWEKVGSDIFEIKGRQYLILVDYFSSFIEVDYLPTLTSENVVLKMKSHFARYGVPKVLVSDCGPQYTSATFSRFTKHWGIRHVRSSPGHHQANGKAEAAVKVVKNMMKRCLIDHEDQYEALLELRNTPRQKGESPAQVMFQRETRTLLPSVAKKNPVFNNDWKRKVDHNLKIKEQFDKKARDMRPLDRHENVYYQNPEKPGWHSGRVSDRSYRVEGETGGTYIRDRVHLRPKVTPFYRRNDDDVTPVPEDTAMRDGNLQQHCGASEYQPDHEVPVPGGSTYTSKQPTSQPTSLKSNMIRPNISTDAQNEHFTTRSGRIVKPNPKYT